MDTIYIEYNFTVFPKEPATEILIAELGAVGFESFAENKQGVRAYIQKKDWNPTILDSIFVLNNPNFQINHTYKEIKQTNWNAEWEKNFTPIQVNNLVTIRAPFHQKTRLKYDIIIEPKMSFGTGHHETTHMMVQHLLTTNLTEKKVLDMGCGTGILAIFAAMKGAKLIDAIDIDAWCYKNSIENIEKNNCKHITVYKGDSELLADKKYDVIIANINRNILLNDMQQYANSLLTKGILLISGFYKEDVPLITKTTTKHKLTLTHTIERNNWASLQFIKE